MERKVAKQNHARVNTIMKHKRVTSFFVFFNEVGIDLIYVLTIFKILLAEFTF